MYRFVLVELKSIFLNVWYISSSVYFKWDSYQIGLTRKSCGNTCLRLVFPQYFSFSQTSTRVSKHGTCLTCNCIAAGLHILCDNCKLFNSTKFSYLPIYVHNDILFASSWTSFICDIRQDVARLLRFQNCFPHLNETCLSCTYFSVFELQTFLFQDNCCFVCIDHHDSISMLFFVFNFSEYIFAFSIQFNTGRLELREKVCSWEWYKIVLWWDHLPNTVLPPTRNKN